MLLVKGLMLSEMSTRDKLRLEDLDFMFLRPGRVGGSVVENFLRSYFGDGYLDISRSFPSASYIHPEVFDEHMDWILRVSPRRIRALTMNYVAPTSWLCDSPSIPCVLTLLRDPVERICSEFYEFRQSVDGLLAYSLNETRQCSDDILAFSREFGRNNSYTRFFSRVGSSQNLTKSDLKTAIRELKSLHFIGFYDALGETHTFLSEACETVESKVSIAAHDVDNFTIPGESIGAKCAKTLGEVDELLREQNAYDYELMQIIRG